MKPLVTICTLLLTFAAAALAQTPDTTSAERYFPLEVGNVWEYEGYDYYEGEEEDERREITEETVIDGIRYFRYESRRVNVNGNPVGLNWSILVRFDTLATAPRYQDGEDFPRYGIPWGFPLGAPFGSEPEYGVCNASVGGGYGRPVEIGDDTATTSVKIADTGGCETSTTFAADVGFVDFITLGGTLTLRYARVGGVEYGESFTTDDEASPDETTGALLEPYPNPARGATTATLSLSVASEARIAVYDVLGREVALLHDGPLAAGQHRFSLDAAGLPAGSYVLRLTTAEGTRTRRLTVVR